MLIYNSPMLIVAAIFAAIAILYFLDKISPLPIEGKGRNVNIDGLRGYLAFLVFLHHSYIWHHFIKTNEWSLPSSHVFANAGQLPVMIFFMITGFLFFSKIIDSKKINWFSLYKSRIFRIYPLYMFSLLIALFIIGYKTGWKLNVSAGELIESILSWMIYATYGNSHINGFSDTGYIYAGIYWTLVYEWLFYFSLPLIAFALRRTKNIFMLVIPAFSLYAFNYLNLNYIFLLPFACGFLASAVRGNKLILKIASLKLTSFLCISGFVFSFFYFPHSFDYLPILLNGAIFILIVNGCDLFGVLKLKISRVFGEISYSIYLMHGIVLYFTLDVLLGKAYVRNLSDNSYAYLILMLSPIVVTIAYMTFKGIEYPFINRNGVINKFFDVQKRMAVRIQK